MTLNDIQKSDLSSITSKSVKERRKELGKTKNAVLLKKDKNKFIFSSPYTFNKNEQYKILIEKQNLEVKVHCTCQAFSKQGFQYRLSQKGGAIFIEKRQDKKWSKYHGGALLCKHLYILLNNQKNILKKLGL